METRVRRTLASILFSVFITTANAHGQSAEGLIAEAAKAMGWPRSTHLKIKSSKAMANSSTRPRPDSAPIQAARAAAQGGTR